MMKKFYIIILPILLSVFFYNCSRKAVTARFDEEKYKVYSRQLESDYSTGISTLSASTEETPLILPNKTLIPGQEACLIVAHVPANDKLVMAKSEKVSFKNIYIKNKLINKLITKRVEKALKKQEANKENSDSGNIVAGIIIGALGLILIGVAAGTAAPMLVYVGGVVLFVAGIILLLVGVF